MKVFAVNGSARRDGNTARLIRAAFEELNKEGVETEMLQLAGSVVRGCTVCDQCTKKKDGRCAVSGDVVNECVAKMAAADGIILASPTYFADITPELKAVIDRTGRVGRASGNLYRRKVGAAIVAVRRAGAMHAFDSINHFFLINQMIVVGSSYWNVGIGRAIGDVEGDEEGIATMRTLGQNMAWAMKRLVD